jgi:hypothetical protein
MFDDREVRAGPIGSRNLPSRHKDRRRHFASQRLCGGGQQMLVDVGIGPAGDVWVTNNWQYYPAALGKVDEALSTLGGGQGVAVFFGMAKPGQDGKDSK